MIRTFKWDVKKKPRKFEEGMQLIANICLQAITYLRNVGKYLEEDKDEAENPFNAWIWGIPLGDNDKQWFRVIEQCVQVFA